MTSITRSISDLAIMNKGLGMKFYSQAGEDKWMIDHHLSQFPAHKRVYFEAGALDGELYSNTLTLERNFGWTGILVEPNPVSFAALQKNRAHNQLHQCLISDDVEEIEFQYFPNRDLAAVSAVKKTIHRALQNAFYNADTKDAWLANEQKTLQTIKVKPKSLKNIQHQSGFDCIGFASLDVEGHELHVFRSHDFDFPVEFLLIESHNHGEHVSLIGRHGYSLLNELAHNLLFHRAIR